MDFSSRVPLPAACHPDRQSPRRGHERLAAHRRTLRALQKDDLKLIWSSDGAHELYHLDRDPGEERNLYDPASPSPEFTALFAELERTVAIYGGSDDRVGGRAATDAVDTETQEALRALGYVR